MTLKDPIELLLSGKGAQLAAMALPSVTDAESHSLGVTIAAGRLALQGPNTPRAAAAYEAGQQAVAELVIANLDITEVLSRQWIAKGHPQDAVVSAAQLALVHAAWRWDHTRGGFEPFAAVTIGWAISRYLHQETRPTRVGRSTVARVGTLVREEAELAQSLGRQPTRRELAAHMGLSVDQVTELVSIRLIMGPGFIGSDTNDPNEDAKHDGVRAFHAKYLAEPSQAPHIAEVSEALSVLLAVANTFPQIQAALLEDLFGLRSGFAGVTSRVAESHGLSRHYVSAIRNEFIARLQHPKFQQQRKPHQQ